MKVLWNASCWLSVTPVPMSSLPKDRDREYLALTVRCGIQLYMKCHKIGESFQSWKTFECWAITNDKYLVCTTKFLAYYLPHRKFSVIITVVTMKLIISNWRTGSVPDSCGCLVPKCLLQLFLLITALLPVSNLCFKTNYSLKFYRDTSLCLQTISVGMMDCRLNQFTISNNHCSSLPT